MGQKGENLTEKVYRAEPVAIERKLAEDALSENLDRREKSQRRAQKVRFLWSERSFLIRVCLIGVACSVLLALVIPTRFTSTARLMPPDNQTSQFAMAAAALSGGSGSGGSTGSGLGEIAGQLLGLRSTSEIFVGILSSRTAKDALIDQFDLKKVYGYQRMEPTRRMLADRTNITVDRKSQIVTIALSDHDPKRAAAMAQAYVAQLNRLVAELSTSAARRERIFLEERLKGVSQDLEKAEKEFSQFSSKHGAIDIKEQGKAMVEATALLQGQLIAAQSELEGLRKIYADSNVRVKASRGRIEELQRQLEKIGGPGQPMSSQDSPSTELYPPLRKLPVLGVTYADLYRQTKVQEAVFEALTKQYELAKVQEAKEIPTVKVLDLPDIPERKDFPPRTLIVLVGAILTFCGAVGFLLTSKSWQERDPQDIQKLLIREIWVDLRERGIWNSQNGSANGAEGGAGAVHRSKRGIRTFLDLRTRTWKDEQERERRESDGESS